MTDAPPRRRRSLLGRVLWALFLALELPLIAAVAAGLAAGVLHPSAFWWAQLCAAFLPYLALVLAAATAGSLLARRWGWLALHGALLASVGVRALPALGPAAPSPGPADLVLMTFNVPQSGPSAEELGDSMVALVAARRPDLIALQDSYVRNAPAEAPVEAPQVAALTVGLSYRASGAPDGTTMVPVLARTRGPRDGTVVVLEQQLVAPGRRSGVDASEALRVRFRWRGREAVLYNLHLRSYGADKPWRDPRLGVLVPRTWLPYLRRYRAAYTARAAEVEALAVRVAAERLPVIVAGDFNEAPFSWAYWRLRRAGAGGSRTDAFRAAGRGDGRTYHGRRPVVRIDYVLADPSFEVTDAVVAASSFSDHRPVVVRLRWREPDERGE